LPGKSGVAGNADSSPGKRPYHLRLRTSNDNAAILEIPAWKDVAPGVQAAAGSSSGEWQMATFVRLDWQGTRSEPVIHLTEARMDNGRYRLKEPADNTSFGSPLWIGNGIAGLLQDRDSAANCTRVFETLQ
jgi:hypothetical protein